MDSQLAGGFAMLDRVSARCFAASSFLLLILAVHSLAAAAQDTSSTVRAARLTSMQGTVTVIDGNNPAVPAQMNLPLLAGVQIATGEDGQAEIEFEDGSIARLTPNSALSLDTLAVDPNGVFTTNLSLLRGLAYFELRATAQYLYSIDAGGDVLSPVENTTVRVDFDEPPASFALLDGTAHVARTGAFQTDVAAGESLRADASNPSRYFLSEQIASDSWDQWNEDMDLNAAAEAADSTPVRDDYAGAQGYGWSDLDADGTWYDVPGQGSVWQPYMAEDDADFDPYGNGAWVWYPGTGYLWASGYAWGWTPYRCGTWSYYSSFGWGWAPGAACGGSGSGFAGGGFAVNIGAVPRGYRTIRVPIAKPGPRRPVLPVHLSGSSPVRGSAPGGQRGPRTIAGLTARPIVPIAGGYVADNGAGGSLRRDFPIDGATHTPAMGLASTRPTTVYHVGQQPQQARQQSEQQPQYGQQQNAQQQGARQGFQRGSGGNGVAPAAQSQLPEVIYGSGAPQPGPQLSQPGQQQQLSGQQGSQRQRGLQGSSQGQQNAQPQPQRYTPPPSERQNNSPPPAPRYSPPPSAAQEPRPSAPSPSAAPEPHASAPPPSAAPAPSHR